MTKPRKPRELPLRGDTNADLGDIAGVWVGGLWLPTSDCRRLAAWLVKAAEWLERDVDKPKGVR